MTSPRLTGEYWGGLVAGAGFGWAFATLTVGVIWAVGLEFDTIAEVFPKGTWIALSLAIGTVLKVVGSNIAARAQQRNPVA